MSKKKRNSRQPIIGKVIKDYGLCRSGVLVDLELKFTDGSSASFLFQFMPQCEGTFFANTEDGSNRKFVVKK